MLASACSLSTDSADLVSSCTCVAYPSELREDNVPAYVLYVDGTAESTSPRLTFPDVPLDTPFIVMPVIVPCPNGNWLTVAFFETYELPLSCDTKSRSFALTVVAALSSDIDVFVSAIAYFLQMYCSSLIAASFPSIASVLLIDISSISCVSYCSSVYGYVLSTSKYPRSVSLEVEPSFLYTTQMK